MSSIAQAGVREHAEYHRPVRLVRDEHGEPIRIEPVGPTRLVNYVHRNPLKNAWINFKISRGVPNPLGEDLGRMEIEQKRELEEQNRMIIEKRREKELNG